PLIFSMGDTEWIEVKRKKHGSVFNRLKFPTYKASMADDLAKISLTAFIKVLDSDALINSISNIWIGKLHLHANVARIAMTLIFVKLHNVIKDSDNGEFKDVGDSHHSVSLQMENSNEFLLAILGCYNDFRAIAHTCSMCRSEGFLDVQFKYLGGLRHDDFVVEECLIWLKIKGVTLRAWNKKTFTHICSKWGKVLFSDNTDRCNRLSKWLCIKSSHASLVFATIMIPLNKVTYVIRVRELCSWTPSFLGEDSVTNDEDFMGKYEADKADFFKNKDAESAVGLANDIGDENIYVNNDKVHDECAHEVPVTTHKYGSKGTGEEPLDSDPFELDSLIKKRDGKDTKVKCSVTPDFPPGFSLNSHENQKDCSVCSLELAKEARERYGSIFNERQAEIFNEFISNSALIDILLGSFSFTWTDKCYLGERHS
ncbi:hypothetical protein Tco_1130597, partial [Tanacetum coccineum]